MNAKRSFYALTALLALLVLALPTAAYGFTQLMHGKSAELMTYKARLAALEQEKLNLAKAKKDIVQFSEPYAIAKAVVPQNKDQAQAVRQIIKIAGDNGVGIQSITFPSSTLGNSPSGGSGPATKLSQLVPVKSIPGVYSLQLTVASDPARPISYPQLISFLSALEHNRQTALITTISIAPSQKSPGYFSFNLTLDTYIKP